MIDFDFLTEKKFENTKKENGDLQRFISEPPYFYEKIYKKNWFVSA